MLLHAVSVVVDRWCVVALPSAAPHNCTASSVDANVVVIGHSRQLRRPGFKPALTVAVDRADTVSHAAIPILTVLGVCLLTVVLIVQAVTGWAWAGWGAALVFIAVFCGIVHTLWLGKKEGRRAGKLGVFFFGD